MMIMTPSERLINWHGKWRISQKVVTCRSCNATQSELDRGSDFPHKLECPTALVRSRPWDELDEIRPASSTLHN